MGLDRLRAYLIGPYTPSRRALLSAGSRTFSMV
jgi:hypothetical protein